MFRPTPCARVRNRDQPNTRTTTSCHGFNPLTCTVVKLANTLAQPWQNLRRCRYVHRCFTLRASVLKFEPRNAIILDYQATLAQYINNGEAWYAAQYLL